MHFNDRREAGRQLAKALIAYENKQSTLVLALPRGGVPVAYEVATQLALPLDLMLVRKLGVPGNEELAMGAIAHGGVQILNDDIVRSLSISPKTIEEVTAREQQEMVRRNQVYRHGNSPPVLEKHTVILVDDGCATGANMHAAILAARKGRAAHIVAATPVASDSAYRLLAALADDVVVLSVPSIFFGVGGFYRDFTQTTDEEVQSLLHNEECKT